MAIQKLCTKRAMLAPSKGAKAGDVCRWPQHRAPRPLQLSAGWTDRSPKRSSSPDQPSSELGDNEASEAKPRVPKAMSFNLSLQLKSLQITSILPFTFILTDLAPISKAPSFFTPIYMWIFRGVRLQFLGWLALIYTDCANILCVFVNSKST